ncbi:MAG: hypothetical protein HKN43_15905 [Rhodothermales bacterium]|nr:hypothetical protein [Rhodothermales bacterium]
MSTRLFTLFAVSSLLFISCDSPTGAGLDLAGGRTGEPVSFSVPPTTFEASPIDDVTGGAGRILAGTVDDPLVGVTSAIGYIDFQLETSLTTDFTAGPVTSVSVTLQKDYIYGDTSAAAQFVLTDIADSWLDSGAQSDTLLTSGSEVMQFAVQPSDTTITLEMPPAWVAANDTTLRSVFFNTAFHGFQVSSPTGAFAAGFDIDGSSLQIVSGGDTLQFSASESLTNVASTGTVAAPADRILIQDGSRIGINLYIDESLSDTLQRSVLSRAALQISVDTTGLASTPPLFIRPTVTTLEFIGTTDNDINIQIRSVEINEEGKFIFESDLFREALQTQFANDPVFESFAIRVPGAINTISPLLIFAPGVPGQQPSVDVTASLFD